MSAASQLAPLNAPPRSSGRGSSGSGRVTENDGENQSPRKPVRLVSLDAYRGFIMMMLAANGFGILGFSRIDESSPVWQSHDHAWWQWLGTQFDHPKWVSLFGLAGVSFWDLIQPAFMFMVGVSMPFSYGRREMIGQGPVGRALHAFVRSVVLVLMGVFLSSFDSERTHWVFPNVLCQIGLGYFFAWLLMNQTKRLQLAALVVILVGYWGWFRLVPPPEGLGPEDYKALGVSTREADGEILTGRFAAWSKNVNAAFRWDEWFLPLLRTDPAPEVQAVPDGSVADDALPENAAALPPDGSESPGMLRRWFFSSNKPYQPNSGGYTTLNFVPSIGTTLLGILCGQLLLSGGGSSWKRLGILIAGAILCLVLGVIAHRTVCPVVKRIWTPSWVLFSGGYVIGILALFYLLFDILPLKKFAFPLVVVGMNSILIYMMGQTIRGWTAKNIVRTHLGGMIESVFGSKALDPQWFGPVTESTATFLVFWLFLFWLYRQRIFLRV